MNNFGFFCFPLISEKELENECQAQLKMYKKFIEHYPDSCTIIEDNGNRGELINIHDALYGTNQFQNRLKEINSPLWIGNMK